MQRLKPRRPVCIRQRMSLPHLGDISGLVYLKGQKNLFRERIVHRTDHFMRQELLDSQFAILEEPADALVIDAARSPADIVRQIRDGLGL